MHFCKVCDNMFYIRLKDQDDNKLIYYCRNCGNEEENFSEETIIISSSKFDKQEKQFDYVINKFYKVIIVIKKIPFCHLTFNMTKIF